MTAVLPQPRAASSLERIATPRRYLMCRPEHFDVSYAINPWMDVSLGVDRELALRQWESLRQTYLDLEPIGKNPVHRFFCRSWSRVRQEIGYDTQHIE